MLRKEMLKLLKSLKNLDQDDKLKVDLVTEALETNERFSNWLLIGTVIFAGGFLLGLALTYLQTLRGL